MAEEWGPWIEHDGKGCPCRGMWVRGKYLDGRIDEWMAGTQRVSSYDLRPMGIGDGSAPCQWSWALEGSDLDRRNRIIRYRIRKPRGLTILENLIADLPAPVTPKVDA